MFTNLIYSFFLGAANSPNSTEQDVVSMQYYFTQIVQNPFGSGGQLILSNWDPDTNEVLLPVFCLQASRHDKSPT